MGSSGLTLTMTVGLPGAGKSCWARQEQEKDPTLVLVSRDDIRAMLHLGKWSKDNEKQIVAIQNHIIADALERSRSVIVHDTNLHPDNEKRLRAIAGVYSATFKVKYFTNVTVEECIKRDLARGKDAGVVGEEVIRRMYRQYLAPKVVPGPLYDPDLPDAIIVDMDGTLALMGDRSPYDTSGLCIHDAVNEPVRRAVMNEYCHNGTCILICSGREDVVREPTEEWLENAGIPWEDLFMRKAGDQRKDSIVKKELYDAHIRGNYNVLYVLDDRTQVVDLWRSLGLTCFQVAPGDF